MTPLVSVRSKVALVWHDEQIGYAQLLRSARARAQQMPPPGSRVVVFGENCPDWIYCACAVWMARAVLVPVDHLATAEELAYVVNDCEPALILCSVQRRTTVERALERVRSRPHVFAFNELELPRRGDAAAPAPLLVDESDLATIVYTSGTTGSPKGVMLSFGNLLANVRPVSRAGYYTSESRVLLLLPLHHVLPLAGSLVAPLFAGSTMVFATSLVGPELVSLMQLHRVTLVVGVPRFYDLLHRALRERINASLIARSVFACAKLLRSRALSRLLFMSLHHKFGGMLRFLVCGGAPLSPVTAETFDVLGFSMCEGYGMSECSPMITFPRPDAIRIGSTGQALDGCEVRIDDNGEILARGPNVMLGYYGRPEDTNAVLRDGWLHTGDLGRFDEQGFLYVTGRLKEILVLPSGKKLDPAVVESALQASPAVREVGVLLDGETLHALIVPNWEVLPVIEPAAAEEWLRREVIDAYNRTVSPYRQVMRITLVNNELPRTRLGKLRRHLLLGIAQRYACAAARPSEADDQGDGAVAQVVSFLARQSRSPVSMDSRLQADLGLDSLGRVELSAFIERAFGVVIPEPRIAEIDTVRALTRLVTQCGGEHAQPTAQEISWAELLRPKTSPALPRSSIYHRVILYFFCLAVRCVFRIRAYGRERLPVRPFILVPNHQSYLDGLFVVAHLSQRLALSTMFYAKELHVRRPWIKALAERCNTIVMDPTRGVLGSLQQLAAGLRNGNNLMIFPEGTRTPDGTLGPFKDSYAILARELAVPVVPVAIRGAYAVLPRGSRVPRLLNRITVTYLPAMEPLKDEPASQFNLRVREKIEAALVTPP